jgi:hypothetical protein
LEEFLFNPLGGLISVLLYLSGGRMKIKVQPVIYWSFLILGTAVFGAIAWMTRSGKPYYIYSQLILFNLVCSLFLAPFVAKEVNLVGVGLAVFVLGTMGFVWDTVGFTYGWWTYYAVTGVAIGKVHIDDFNFFMFAPTSAISIYILTCRMLKTPQIQNDK